MKLSHATPYLYVIIICHLKILNYTSVYPPFLDVIIVIALISEYGIVPIIYLYFCYKLLS